MGENDPGYESIVEIVSKSTSQFNAKILITGKKLTRIWASGIICLDESNRNKVILIPNQSKVL